MVGAASKLAFCTMLLGVVVLSATAPATAASRVCRQLEADLASSTGGGRASPAQIGKYDSAIARQSAAIGQARESANGIGCGFSLLGGNVAACASLNASLEQMSRNLDKLQRKRAQLAGGGRRLDRARILASMEAKGCRNGEIAAHEQKSANRRLAGKALDDATYRLEGPAAQEEVQTNRQAIVENGIINVPRQAGSFRTLCVRTCDGYFFPMSNAASPSDFGRDQKNCESSCPGTEIEVFYTRGMSDSTESMTSSVTGRPYSALSTAYLYKKPGTERPPGCGCNAAQNFEIIAGNPSEISPETASGEAGSSSFVPIPVARPDLAADPETLANSDGGLDVGAIRRLAVPPDNSVKPLAPVEERKIRVVGPAFLPAQEAATDPQAPAPTSSP